MSLKNTANEAVDEEFADKLKPDTKLMLGQYTIEGFLAAGGFGITYLAKDSLGRRVVIKECFPGSFCRRQNHSVMPRSRAHQNELKSIVRLFSQEAMALAKMNHPNIVGVHQVFEENNTAYMALDYVHGRDLLEILEENPETLKPDLVEGYLVKILDAVKHIHILDMLHRDIAPDNIIINEAGEPILIDFGAARESSNERVTRMLSAMRVVKDGYSPQEFYIAGSEQGPSCDLYSLAASFYHIATGELPPDSQARLSACAAGDEDPYVSLGEKTDAYSKRFVTALDKAMSVLPRDRMQSADEWLAHLGGEVEAAPAAAAAKPAKAAAATGEKKSFMPILLGTTAIAAAAGAGFFYFSNTGTEAPSATLDGGNVVATAPATPAPTVTPEPAPATPAPATETATVTPEPAPAAPEATAEAAAPVFPLPTAPAEPEPETAAIPEPAQPETAVEPEIAALPTPVEPEAPAVVTPEPEAPIDVAALPTPVVPDLPQIRPAPRPVIEAAPEPVLPDLPEVENVTVEIAGLTPPAVEEASIIAPARLEALDPTGLPAGIDSVQVATSALQDVQPVIDTTAPEAPAPEPEPVVVAEPEPAPVVEPEPAPEPVVVAEAEPAPQPEAAAPASDDNSSLAFFMAMGQNNQPDIVSAARPSTAAAAPAPAAPAAAPAPAATPAAAPATGQAVSAEEAGIVTRYVPILPFTLSSWQPGMAAFVGDNGPAWLTQSARIVTINGQRVDTNDQIVAELEKAAAASNTALVDVTFGIEPQLNAAIEEHTLALETEQHTLLLNGLRLAAREANGTWITEIVDAPAGSNFRAGDALVSYVATWEDLNGPDSLTTILERELAKGTSTFSFAVSRDGEIWVEAFNLTSLAN